jgi:hypothetical protein
MRNVEWENNIEQNQVELHPASDADRFRPVVSHYVSSA